MKGPAYIGSFFAFISLVSPFCGRFCLFVLYIYVCIVFLFYGSFILLNSCHRLALCIGFLSVVFHSSYPAVMAKRLRPEFESQRQKEREKERKKERKKRR